MVYYVYDDTDTGYSEAPSYSWVELDPSYGGSGSDLGMAYDEMTNVSLAFTFRFYSEEIETFFTITLDEDHLVLQQRRLDDADLTPGEEDEFSGGGFQISFERDRNGQVVAFYLANTRTRDVRFQRVR